MKDFTSPSVTELGSVRDLTFGSNPGSNQDAFGPIQTAKSLGLPGNGTIPAGILGS